MRKKLIVFLMLLSLVLTACGGNAPKNETKKEIEIKDEKKVVEEDLFINNKREKVKVLKTNTGYLIEFKNKVYSIDNKQYNLLKNKNDLLFTFDNKVLKQFKEEEIEAYDNYGSFYQVLLKNGNQIQVFDKPSEKMEVRNDYSKLNDGKNIKAIYKHGDHWHVLYSDGNEIITYKDPTKIDAKELEKSKVKLVSDNEIKKDKIVKVLKHGDHYHIYLADGTEYISHDRPTNLPTGVVIGEYNGPAHGQKSNSNKTQNSQNQANTGTKRRNDTSQENKNNHSSHRRIKVVNLEFLKNINISQVKVHGDHYHVYDNNGNEYITYDSAVRKLVDKVTDYEGNHGETSNDSNKPANPNDSKPSVENNKKDETQSSKPTSKKKSEVKSINQKNGKWEIELQNGEKIIVEKLIYENGKINLENLTNPNNSSNLENLSGSGSLTKKDNSNIDKPKKEYIDPLTGEKVVKVLKHGDHYHIYYENGEENVMFEDPRTIWPGIEIGEYQGSHSDNHKNPEKKPKKEPEKDIDKKPIPDNKKENKLTYDKVIAKLAVKDYETAMSYGGMIYTTGFDKEKNEFIVPHHDHYHNITIDRIIDLASKGAFGRYSAEEVIATMKYFVENPDKRPKKAGWGDSANGETEEENEEHDELKLNYIAKKYGVNRYNMSQFFRIGNTVNIYLEDETIQINLSDLSIKNGKVEEDIKLPKKKKN